MKDSISTTDSDRSFFRCPVTSEKSHARLRLGTRRISVTVLETSNGGYTLAIPQRYLNKVNRSKKPLLLAYDEFKVLISPEWVSEPQDGVVRIGFRQEKELIKTKPIHTSLWQRFRPHADPSGNGSVIAYGGFVLVLFCVMSMPGLGEKLGTSERIQHAVGWFVDSASEQIGLWLG